MKLYWPLLFSVLSFFGVFVIIFLVFISIKPSFISTINKNGEKDLEWGKSVVYAMLFSFICAVIVLLYSISAKEYPKSQYISTKSSPSTYNLSY